MYDEPPIDEAERPLAYFITFSCYGSRLHGDAKGSVDRFTNSPGQRLVEESLGRVEYQRRLMKEAAFAMDEAARRIVLGAVRQHCEFRLWLLHAAHVRSSHVHVVVASDRTIEIVMSQLKARGLRGLRGAGYARKKYWANHGSTKQLWKTERVDDVVKYVVYGQGSAMAVYCHPNWRQ